MAVRMEAVRDAGLMVEVALVGAEEVEWHRRFHEHGWRVVFLAEASVIHHGSQSVASSAGNLYSEYLKGMLYFFRIDRSRLTYLAFCSSLLAMFTAQAGLAWIRRDRAALDAARKFNQVTWDGVKATFQPALR